MNKLPVLVTTVLSILALVGVSTLSGQSDSNRMAVSRIMDSENITFESDDDDVLIIQTKLR